MVNAMRKTFALLIGFVLVFTLVAAYTSPVATQLTSADEYLLSLISNKPGNEHIVVIVTTKHPVTSYIDDLEKTGVSVRYVYPAVDAVSIKLPIAKLFLLERLDFVQRIYSNVRIRIADGATYDSSGSISATGITFTANLDRIKVEYAWARGYMGNGTTICIIDTGIDASHVSLDDLDDNPNTDDPKVIGWLDLVNNKTSPYDDEGHGSHVAGIAAGTPSPSGLAIGVAPGAWLVGIKVLNENGTGTEEALLAAFQWILDHKDDYHGIDVVSMSLSADIPANMTTGVLLIDQMTDMLVMNGMVVTVAAGNAGPDSMSLGTPSSSRMAITVGNVEIKGASSPVADSSSRGPTWDGRVKPEVTAPGTQITSVAANTHDKYVQHTGTSMATPHVAGLAAILRQVNPDLSPLAIKYVITNTSISTDRTVTTRPDNIEGYGLIQVDRAIRGAQAIDGIPEITMTIDVPNQVSIGNNVTVTVTTDQPNVSIYMSLIAPNGTIIDAVAGWTDENGEGVLSLQTFDEYEEGDYTIRVVGYKLGFEWVMKEDKVSLTHGLPLETTLMIVGVVAIILIGVALYMIKFRKR